MLYMSFIYGLQIWDSNFYHIIERKFCLEPIKYSLNSALQLQRQFISKSIWYISYTSIQSTFFIWISPIPSLPHIWSCTDWTSCQLLRSCPTLWSACRLSLTLLTPWSRSGIGFWALRRSSSSPWSRISSLQSFGPRILSESCRQGAVRFPPKAHTLWHVSFHPRMSTWSVNQSGFPFTFP